MRERAVPVLSALIAATLSSGATAAYLRATQPEVLSVRTPFQTTPEQRHLALLLVAPGAPYAPAGRGSPVDVAALGRGQSAEGMATLGFRRGWAQAWTSPRKERVDAFLLEFADATGATGYARGIGHAASLLIKPEPFVVPGVPEASGLADTVRDRNGMYAQVVVLHRGARAVLLVFTDASARPPAAAVTLAQRQYAALAAP
ncbi:MAG TPA: hypothetical protein VFQ85_09080 [Mycobacteriales bacterium]|jgi:hypothetical protein|nr:hypothetical protein [Mycobacteriales bacterium]